MKRILLSWSSGKDSAWELHLLRQQPAIELVGLLTTLNTEFQRVAMHGTRRSVLESQAAAAQLPLWVVPLNAKTKEFFMLADSCIIHNAGAVKKIIIALHLPEDTEPMSDSRYRCTKCLRRTRRGED
jgi:diphthamide synthase (EF-2-diphthine--ammonia ligase)